MRLSSASQDLTALFQNLDSRCFLDTIGRLPFETSRPATEPPAPVGRDSMRSEVWSQKTSSCSQEDPEWVRALRRGGLYLTPAYDNSYLVSSSPPR
jgi:hypothetical protein